ALDVGVEKSIIFAPAWRGNWQTNAVEGLSQSHQPSLARREGMGIRRTVTGLQCRLCVGAEQLFGRSSARVQEFYAVSVQGRLRARVRYASLIRRWSRPVNPTQQSSFMQIIKRIGLILI